MELWVTIISSLFLGLIPAALVFLATRRRDQAGVQIQKEEQASQAWAEFAKTMRDEVSRLEAREAKLAADNAALMTKLADCLRSFRQEWELRDRGTR